MLRSPAGESKEPRSPIFDGSLSGSRCRFERSHHNKNYKIMTRSRPVIKQRKSNHKSRTSSFVGDRFASDYYVSPMNTSYRHLRASESYANYDFRGQNYDRRGTKFGNLLRKSIWCFRRKQPFHYNCIGVDTFHPTQLALTQYDCVHRRCMLGSAWPIHRQHTIWATAAERSRARRVCVPPFVRAFRFEHFQLHLSNSLLHHRTVFI